MAETRRILIKVESNGEDKIKVVDKSLRELNKTVKDAGDSFNSMKSKFLGLAATFGVGVGLKSFMDMADAMSLLRDRTEVMTGSASVASTIIDRIHDAANRTKTSIEEFAASYQKLTIATMDTKLTSSDLLSITEGLTQTFKLSKASPEQLATGMTLLTKAFETGTVKGRELNSMIKTNGVLFQLLKADLGVTGDGMKKLLTDGIPVQKLLETLARHSGELNEKASHLSQTFGQTVVIAINDLTVAFSKLNDEFKLQDKFSEGVKIITENLGILAAVFTALAISAIPSFIASLEKAALAIDAFLVSNPLTATFALIGAALIVVVSNLDLFKKDAEIIFTALKIFLQGVLTTIVAMAGAIAGIFGSNRLTNYAKELKEDMKSSAEELRKFAQERERILDPSKKFSVADLRRGDDANTLDASKYGNKGGGETERKLSELESLKQTLGALNVMYNQGRVEVTAYNKVFEELSLKIIDLKFRMGDISKKKSAEEILGVKKTELSTLFEAGSKSIHEFIEEGNKIKGEELQAKFNAGAIGLAKLHEGQQQIKKDNLANDFENSGLAVEEFTKRMRALDLETITQKFKDGKASSLEYHQAVLKLSDDFQPGAALAVGIEQYIESAGNLSQNVAKLVTSVFNGLEDHLFQFVKTGKFGFKDFANSIIDDIERIAIKMLLIRAITGAFGSVGSIEAPSADNTLPAFENTTGQVAAANGGAWMRGVQMFANGGVVGSPTMFRHANGLGVMGEAGPEAIMPLSRGSDGKLGVKGSGVIVNIINNAGVEVQQSETTGSDGQRVMNLVIAQKVKEMFANGTMDKSMRQSYGVSRQGV